MHTILIVEDDRSILNGIKINLSAQGFTVLCAETGADALNTLKNHPEIELVLLDIMLPDISGFELITKIKSQNQHPKVLFLTARSDIYDKISGFSLGADDYITKPFDIREVILRIQARLKQSPSENRICFGNITLDTAEFRVYKNNIPMAMTRYEFEILVYLHANKNIVISREMLLERLWNISENISSRSIDMHISNIRKKIEDDPKSPQYIKTVHGVGYVLSCK